MALSARWLIALGAALLLSTPLATGTAMAATGCQGVTVTPTDDVQRMIDARPGGTTFCFKAGVYRVREPIMPRRGDILIGARGAVISGAVKIVSWNRDGGDWVATGQRAQAQPTNADCRPEGYTGCRYPEGVFIDDRPLRQVTSRTKVTESTFFFDYAADRIYIGVDPSGRTVELSVAPAGFAGYVGTHDQVTIRGFVIEKFATLPSSFTAAVKPGGKWLIVDNEIRYSHTNGISVTGGSIVRNNHIHHNGLAGIRGQGDHITIEANRISKNNIERFSFAYSGGVRMTGSRDVLLKDNEVTGNLGAGLKMDTDVIDARYVGNTVVGNAAAGIDHEASYDAVIEGNYLRDNGRISEDDNPWGGGNISVLSSPNVTIRGNTIVSSIPIDSVMLKDMSRGSGRYGTHEIRNVHVANNEIRMVSGANAGLVGSGDLPTGSVTFDGNRYYVKDLSHDHWRIGSEIGWSEWQDRGFDLNGSLSRWT